MTAQESTERFFLAVIVVLLACRVVSLLAAKLRQPPVVGEMVAGVLLGPSLFGLLAPDAQAAVFPDAIRPLLYAGGQIGLVVFMFGAGYAFSLHSVRGSARSVGAVSVAGTAVPLALGFAVTLLGAHAVPLLRPGVSPLVSAAFVGVALAITAFPMLARIVTERGLAGTRLGSLALACGAADDALAWLLLAVVLSLHAASAGPALLAVGGAAVFAVLLATLGRRALARALSSARLTVDHRVLVTAVALFAAAWFTDEIGLYAVFGAFCTGLVFPRGPAGDAVLGRLLPFGQIVLLPLFFTYSGLNTRFALLADPALLGFAVVCVLVAVAGKLGTGWAAARLAGEPGPVAVRLGVLINARGLMQLIALNVGLEAGIVSPALFTVLVVVALVTTVLTAPALDLLDRRQARRAAGTALIPSGQL